MGAIEEERLLLWRCFWTMEESMNNRQGMQVRALCMFDSQIGALVKTERKRIRKRIKRIYRMAPPKQLSKAEAEKLTMDIFGCNADEARKILSTN
jgi:hypothetical protein